MMWCIDGLLIALVLAVHKSISEVAQDFESVFDFKPEVRVLGSLEDLKKVTITPEGMQNPVA